MLVLIQGESCLPSLFPEPKHRPGFLVQQLHVRYRANCAFFEDSMKLGTVLDHDPTMILERRAIAENACSGVGSHFPKWPPFLLVTYYYGLFWYNKTIQIWLIFIK